MHMASIAISSRCLTGSVKQKIIAARSLNVDGLQFDARNELKTRDLSETGRRQFLHLLSEVSLKVASLNFPTRRSLCDPDRLDARVEGVRQAMLFAAQLKTKVVTVRLGSIPVDHDSEQWKIMCDVLNDLVSYGNHIGAILSITPSHQPLDSVLDLLAHIEKGPIGINFDPAQLVLSDQKPIELLQRLHQYVSHVVVRDAVRDESLGGGIEVPVGRGEVVWDELIATLSEAGYNGWMTVDRSQGDDILGDATRAIQFVRNISLG